MLHLCTPRWALRREGRPLTGEYCKGSRFEVLRLLPLIRMCAGVALAQTVAESGCCCCIGESVPPLVLAPEADAGGRLRQHDVYVELL